MVADQNQRQFRVGQQAFFHNVGVFLIQGAVPQSLFHLLIIKCSAQCDVVPDGGVEQEHILLNVAHLLLKLLWSKVFGILVIEADNSAVVWQPAQKEFEQGGFPAAGGADERIFTALLELEGQALQDGAPAVLKVQIFDSDGVRYRVSVLYIDLFPAL